MKFPLAFEKAPAKLTFKQQEAWYNTRFDYFENLLNLLSGMEEDFYMPDINTRDLRTLQEIGEEDLVQQLVDLKKVNFRRKLEDLLSKIGDIHQKYENASCEIDEKRQEEEEKAYKLKRAKEKAARITKMMKVFKSGKSEEDVVQFLLEEGLC